MDINGTSCCAVNEFHGLSYARSAEESMVDFCDQLYSDGSYNTIDGPACSESYAPSAHYIFTGVVNGRGRDYGGQFRAFIRRHKLGKVVETVSAPNRVNHPDHKVKVWVWTPSPKALLTWWRSYCKKVGRECEVTTRGTRKLSEDDIIDRRDYGRRGY